MEKYKQAIDNLTTTEYAIHACERVYHTNPNDNLLKALEKLYTDRYVFRAHVTQARNQILDKLTLG